MSTIFSTEIFNIFEQDQIAMDNRGIIWYDNSPEVLALASNIQRRMEEEFREWLSKIGSKKQLEI